MKKHILSIWLVIISALLFCLIALPVTAKNDNDFSITEEKEGTFDVPGNPKLKLKVFVHNPKDMARPGKPPTVTPTPYQQCGLFDPDSPAIVGLTGWHLIPGNVSYRINTNSAPSLINATDLVNLTVNSFNEWSKTAVGGQVKFVNSGYTSVNRATYDGQNIITWGRTSGSALAVTYTWYYPDNGEVAETDTIFNNKYKWAWSGGNTTCAYPNVYDAQDILTHELGHWVGLNDHYTAEFAENTMFGYGSTMEVKKNTLTTGDIQAVDLIYLFE